MKKVIEDSALPFVPEPAFDRDSLERRSELLYEITKRIWGV
jgi:hypothetical protein